MKNMPRQTLRYCQPLLPRIELNDATGNSTGLVRRRIQFNPGIAASLSFATTPEQWRLIQSRISDVFGESEALSLRLSLAGAGRWAVANPVDKASEEDLLTR
jgi:hypothetical protein